MGAIVAIGERSRVRGFGLAGVRVVDADDTAAVRGAWRGLPATVSVVLLTPAAAAALAGVADGPGAAGAPLTAVLPS